VGLGRGLGEAEAWAGWGIELVEEGLLVVERISEVAVMGRRSRVTHILYFISNLSKIKNIKERKFGNTLVSHRIIKLGVVMLLRVFV